MSCYGIDRFATAGSSIDGRRFSEHPGFSLYLCYRRRQDKPNETNKAIISQTHNHLASSKATASFRESWSKLYFYLLESFF